MSSVVDDSLPGPLAPEPRGAEGASHHFMTSLYRRYLPGLCRYLSATFGGGTAAADDIAQAAFSNLVALPDPQNIRDPRAFLYRTARNIALRQREREGIGRRVIQLTTAGDEESTDGFDPERILMAQERYALLDRALRAMHPEQRRMLVLSRMHDLSYAEIARLTGVSQTHVKRLVAQGLMDCKQALSRQTLAPRPRRDRTQEREKQG